MKIRLPYLPLIGFALLALLAALWAGLVRIGWALPAFPALANEHGPLMVCGFLGTLIALERAVAIRQKWMFAVPALAGLGWVALIVVPFPGAVLLTLSSLGTLAILGVMVRRELQAHTLTMAIGVAAWVVGNIFWLAGHPIYQIVYWWLAFLILTIGGERLELSRVMRPGRGQVLLFGVFAAVLVVGTILIMVDPFLGARLMGVGMLALAVWFVLHDLARRNLGHRNPLTRYIAVCLFSGFLWLGIAGILFMVVGATFAGPLYDAALHTIFIGFVISMIFGHAPMILPAVLGTQIRFSPVFYGPFALLHFSLLLRISGDLNNQPGWRMWGGLFNAVAILVFLGWMAFSILQGRKA